MTLLDKAVNNELRALRKKLNVLTEKYDRKIKDYDILVNMYNKKLDECAELHQNFISLERAHDKYCEDNPMNKTSVG